MAKIILTAYECERDLLPAVCAKCGAPAGSRVLRTLRVFETNERPWTFRRLARGLGRLGLVCVFFVGFVFFPWLVRLMTNRYARPREVRVPMCEAHRPEWDRLDRLSGVLFPVWCVLTPTGWVCGIALAVIDVEFYPVLFVTPCLLPYLSICPDMVFSLWTVQLWPVGPGRRIRLSGVAPAFVAAVVADRARHRVSDPDRRPTRGGTEDDYDDEPV